MDIEPNSNDRARTPWPATEIEMRPVADLVAYARNARTHTSEQVDQIVASIGEWGWTVPVLIDEENSIIAGHGRTLAAERMGLVEVPCVVARGWTEPQKQAYRIADNQLAINAGWNPDLLKIELGELAKVEFDLALIGFPDLQLVEFMSGLGEGAQPRQSGLGSLAEKFGVPPFSVLNARDGWWQDRKRAWLDLGIQSELGRGENLIGRSPQELFAHLTGIAYDKARTIVTEAMAAEGDAFDLQALVAKHGGRPVRQAVPGGGTSQSRSAALPLDRAKT